MLYSYNKYFLEKFKYNLDNSIFDKIYKYSKNNINNLFIKFNEKDILIDIVSHCIYLLYIGLNIENIKKIDSFLDQLSLNNNNNFYAIVNLILPYLDDKDNNFSQKNIKSLKDLVEKEFNSKKLYSNYFYDHNNISNMTFSDNYKKYNSLEIEVDKNLNSNLLNNYYDNISLLIFEIINSVRYKLYINWINIFPLTLNNYKKSKLYINSNKLNFPLFNVIDKSSFNKDLIKNISNLDDLIKESNEMAFNYAGLNMEDIYNCLVNDFYLSTIRVKWLIFNNAVNKKIFLNIKILDDILNLKNIYDDKTFNLLTDLEKTKFEKNWFEMKKIVKNNSSFKIYNNEIITKLFRSLVVYFEFNYNKVNDLVKEKKYKLIIKENTDDLDKIYEKYVEFSSIDLNIFIDAIENVSVNDIYNFLYEEIMYLKNTIYYDKIFIEKKVEFKKIDIQDKNFEIPPKYFYNFAKNLYEPYSDEYKLKNLWSGLSIEQKYLIVHKLNLNENNQDWFKITKLLSEFDKYDNVKFIQKKIYKKIKDNLIDIIFESLIVKGCINKFELHPELVDNKILTTDFVKRNKKRGDNMLKVLNKEKIKEYQEGYYYANNKKYKDVIVNSSNKVYNVNYVEYISKIGQTGDFWNTFYAMNWVSQIDFYFKFLNQRVMLVTGATGQGKSTQVPKLYLYGLKSFLYKNNGKIVCTVPRKDPTLENTKNISSSMGIGIEEYSNYYNNNVVTLNHTIQYNIDGASHKKDSNYYLRIVTDGLLLQIIKNNMLLKRNSNKKILDNNIFDVVMIDEAHEHNPNMDIILTIMRHTLFYNNDIKLSIISATMEEDEPIFRRFYRFIDDNLTYPINLHNLSCGIDRNLIDRRYHISPPGATTQYIVEEFYENNSEDTYESNKKLAIDTVKNIFQTTTEGDILLFSTVVSEIHKLVIELNKIIPSNCIAIPYYSKLDEKFKVFSKEGKAEIEKITFHRDDIIKLFTKEIKENEAQKVNAKTYNRGCIIATNVAEASLTIKSLKFVVDLGYENEVSYNYEIDNNEQKIEKITEASRKQRKGRVGRVSSGKIYHMYPEGSRELIKPKYKIYKDEFSENFIKLLSSNNKEIIETNLIKKLTTFKSNFDENQIKKMEKVFTTEYIINNQYHIDDFYKSNVNLNDTNLKQEIYQFLFPSFMDGFSYNQLLDLSGFFYIINPFEKKRDINSGNFINENCDVEILSENCLNKFYKKALITNDLILYKNKIFKTEYNIIKEKIPINIFRFDERFKRGFITLNLLNDNLKNIDLLFIFVYNLIFSKISKSKEIYKDSELYHYYDIFTKLNDRVNFEKFDDKLFEETKQISKKIISQNITDINDIIKFCKKNNYDIQKYNSIVKSLLEGDFSKEKILEIISDDDNNIIKEELLKNNDVKEFIKSQNIENEEALYLLEKSIKEKNKVKTFSKMYAKELIKINKIFKFNKYNNNFKVMLLSFLTSFIDQVYFIENDITRNIYTNIQLNLKKRYNLENINSIGFYCLNSNFIDILSNIKIEDLKMINPLISNNVKNNPFIEYDDKIDYNLFFKNYYETMEGGFLFMHKIQKVDLSLKMSLETIKKFIPEDYLKDNLDEINEYDYGYFITDNKKNNGIYLIKLDIFRIVKIKKIKGTEFLNNYLKNKFLYNGFIVINID